MKKIIFITCLLLICSGVRAQMMNKRIQPGVYTSKNESHNNRHHYEEITLNSDRSFKYKAHVGEFINIDKFGKWEIDNDTLILNEHEPEYSQMMSVVEKNVSLNPNFGVNINAKYFDGDDFLFTVSATSNDTTVILRNNNTGHSTIPLTKIKEFIISSTSYNYPKYIVKDATSNNFVVLLSPKRLFINEKWLLENGRIRPRTTEGIFAGYYLSIKP